MNRVLAWQPRAAPLAPLIQAGVGLWGGWPQQLDPEGPVVVVAAFRLLPEILVRPFAYGLPMMELVLGLLLLVGLGTRIAALLTGLMMIMFLVGIGSAWARGLSIDCGCFGSTGETVADPVPGYIRDILRDTGLLALAAFVSWRPPGRLALDARLGASPIGVTR